MFWYDRRNYFFFFFVSNNILDIIASHSKAKSTPQYALQRESMTRTHYWQASDSLKCIWYNMHLNEKEKLILGLLISSTLLITPPNIGEMHLHMLHRVSHKFFGGLLKHFDAAKLLYLWFPSLLMTVCPYHLTVMHHWCWCWLSQWGMSLLTT